MAKKGLLKIATAQFPVSGDIVRNAGYVKKQISEAKKKGAEIIHFSETALSGYAGSNFKSFIDFDWETLKKETQAICALAKSKKIWVILGSSHPLSGKHKPHNSLYVINDKGKIIDRYDKRFCTNGDLKNYTAGNHFPIFKINGVKCGLLICYDMRFPELYRAYYSQGVRVMFHSFHNVIAPPRKTFNIWGEIMTPSLRCRAATNFMFVSANNSSAKKQCWTSLFILPNGLVEKKCPLGKTSLIICKVDLSKPYYNAGGDNTNLSIEGRLNSGNLVKDKRSSDKKCL